MIEADIEEDVRADALATRRSRAMTRLSTAFDALHEKRVELGIATRTLRTVAVVAAVTVGGAAFVFAFRALRRRTSGGPWQHLARSWSHRPAPPGIALRVVTETVGPVIVMMLTEATHAWFAAAAAPHPDAVPDAPSPHVTT